MQIDAGPVQERVLGSQVVPVTHVSFTTNDMPSAAQVRTSVAVHWPSPARQTAQLEPAPAAQCAADLQLTAVVVSKSSLQVRRTAPSQ
jgi:hypothetical protein